MIALTEKTRNVFEAYRIKNAPDFSRPITEEQWGDIVVTIDKTTPLAVLFSHKAQVEDVPNGMPRSRCFCKDT